MLFIYLMIGLHQKIMVYSRECLLAKRNTSIHSCYLTLNSSYKVRMRAFLVNTKACSLLPRPKRQNYVFCQTLVRQAVNEHGMTIGKFRKYISGFVQDESCVSIKLITFASYLRAGLLYNRQALQNKF